MERRWNLVSVGGVWSGRLVGRLVVVVVLLVVWYSTSPQEMPSYTLW